MRVDKLRSSFGCIGGFEFVLNFEAPHHNREALVDLCAAVIDIEYVGGLIAGISFAGVHVHDVVEVVDNADPRLVAFGTIDLDLRSYIGAYHMVRRHHLFAPSLAVPEDAIVRAGLAGVVELVLGVLVDDPTNYGPGRGAGLDPDFGAPGVAVLEGSERHGGQTLKICGGTGPFLNSFALVDEVAVHEQVLDDVGGRTQVGAQVDAVDHPRPPGTVNHAVHKGLHLGQQLALGDLDGVFQAVDKGRRRRGRAVPEGVVVHRIVFVVAGEALIRIVHARGEDAADCAHRVPFGVVFARRRVQLRTLQVKARVLELAEPQSTQQTDQQNYLHSPIITLKIRYLLHKSSVCRLYKSSQSGASQNLELAQSLQNSCTGLFLVLIIMPLTQIYFQRREFSISHLFYVPTFQYKELRYPLKGRVLKTSHGILLERVELTTNNSYRKRELFQIQF